MTAPIRHDFCDGKYSIVDHGNGNLEALRHGEPWPARDLVGDNLVYWMLVRIRELTEQVETLQVKLDVQHVK